MLHATMLAMFTADEMVVSMAAVGAFSLAIGFIAGVGRGKALGFQEYAARFARRSSLLGGRMYDGVHTTAK